MSFIEVIDSQKILYIAGLATILYAYVSFFAIKLASSVYTKDPDTLAYEKLNQEVEKLKAQAKLLNTMDTFTECALVRRKIIPLEKELSVLAAKVPRKAFETSPVYRLLVSIGPYVSAAIFLWFMSGHDLYRFNTPQSHVTHDTSAKSNFINSALSQLSRFSTQYFAMLAGSATCWFFVVWTSLRYIHNVIKSVIE